MKTVSQLVYLTNVLFMVEGDKWTFNLLHNSSSSYDYGVDYVGRTHSGLHLHVIIKNEHSSYLSPTHKAFTFTRFS